MPGAPDQVDLNDQRGRKAHRQPAAGRRLLQRRKARRCRSASSRKTRSARATTSGVEVNTSKYNRTHRASTRSTRTSRPTASRARIDVYHRTSRPVRRPGRQLLAGDAGAGLRFGVPFSETRHRVSSAAALERTDDQAGHQHPGRLPGLCRAASATPATRVPLTIGWSRDDRDSALAPDARPLPARSTAKWGVAGDARYVRGNYQYQQYVPLNKQYTLAFNGELGWGKGLTGRPFPVFKNFYSGGLGSVRGFEQGTLGPRDVTGAIDRRRQEDHAQRRGDHAVPGRRQRPHAAPVRLRRRRQRVSARTRRSTLQRDARFGRCRAVSWISPVGPLRMAVAQPVRKFAGDRIQKLQFQIGTSF